MLYVKDGSLVMVVLCVCGGGYTGDSSGLWESEGNKQCAVGM